MAAPVTPNMTEAQQRLQRAMLLQQQSQQMNTSTPAGGIMSGISAVAAAMLQRNAMKDYQAAQQAGLDQTADAVAGMWGGMGGGSPPSAVPPSTSPPMSSPPPMAPQSGMGGVPSPPPPSGPDPLMWSDRGPGGRLLMVPQSAVQPGEQAFGVTPGTIGAGGMGGWFGGAQPTGMPGAPPMGMGGPPQPTSVPYPTPGYNPQAAGPGAPPPSGPAAAVQMMGESVSAPPPWNPLSPTPIAQSPSIQGNTAMFSGVPHSEEATQAYNWFAQRWGPIAAAGIVGNLVNESGARLDPTAVHDKGTGLGIAGWRLERRDALLNFAAQNGMDPRSRETQFMFLDHELRTDESPIGERLRKAATPQEAAVIMLDYERPGGWNRRDPTGSNGYQNRINAALAYTNEADPRGMNAPIPPEMMAGMEGPGAQFGFSPEAFGATQPGVTMQAPGMQPRTGLPPAQFNDRFAAAGGLPPTRDIRQQVAQQPQQAFAPPPGSMAPQAPMAPPPQPMASQAPPPQMAPQQPPQAGGGMLANAPPVQQGDPYAHIPMQTRQTIDRMLRNPATFEMGQQMLQDAMSSKPPERWEPFEIEGGGIAQRNAQTGQIQILVQPGEKGSIGKLGGPNGDQMAWISADGREVRYLGEPLGQEDRPPVVQKITQPDGSEVAVQWDRQSGQWVPMQAPTGGAAVRGPAKLTEQQSKDVGFYTRGKAADEVLAPIEQALTNVPDAMGAQVPFAGNMIVSDEFQRARQAGQEFLASILRKDTGAAVTPSEFEMYGAIYLPRPGDGPDVIAQKRASRQRAMEAVRAGLGPGQIIADELAARQQGAPGASPAPGAGNEGWIEVAPGIRMRQVQ